VGGVSLGERTDEGGDVVRLLWDGLQISLRWIDRQVSRHNTATVNTDQPGVQGAAWFDQLNM
jgi:hypothetical protein